MDILNEIEGYVEGEMVQPDTKHTENNTYDKKLILDSIPEDIREELVQDEKELAELRELSDAMHYPQIDYQQKRVHEYFINDQKRKSKKKTSKNKKAMVKASRKKNRKKK